MVFVKLLGSDIHNHSRYHLNQENDCSYDVPRQIGLPLSHIEEFDFFSLFSKDLVSWRKEEKNAATTTA